MSREHITNQSVDWKTYLDQYHEKNAGITERLLLRAEAPNIGTPYEWLASKIKNVPGTNQAPLSILDIGCGSAPMKSLLPIHWNYLGIDLSVAELRKAREAGRAQVILADATRIPLAANSMDGAISSMAMMLVSPIELALSETFRVIKPGAVFAFTRPSIAPFWPRDLLVGFNLVSSLRALPAMPQRFTKRRIQGLLESCGFVGIRHEGKRFSFKLCTADDAKLLVDSLYLPGMADAHKLRAANKLATWASKGREIPITLAMSVARKNGSL